MSTTATARMTFGALLGTVATTANAVTSVVNTGVEGVSMLDRFVKKHATQQKIDHAADMADYAWRVGMQKAQELATLKQEVRAFCDKSEQHAADYAESFNSIMEAIKAVK